MGGSSDLSYKQESSGIRASRHGLKERIVFTACLFILLLVLGAKVYRASLESTLWMDEVFSLQLSTKNGAQISDLASLDNHPPLYYHLLHAWVTLPSFLGFQHSVHWARLLNILIWVGTTAGIWILLRRVTPSWHSAWGAVLFAISPNIVQFTQDVRGYGLAVCAISIVFALLVAVEGRADSAPVAHLALAFAAASAIAYWSHLIAWVPTALLGCVWFTQTLRSGRPRRSQVLFTAFAPILAVLSIIPWAIRVPGQIHRLSNSAPGWMTEPSALNLARVFAEWLPFGRDGFAGLSSKPLALALTASMVLCLAISMVEIGRRKVAPTLTGEAFSIQVGLLGLLVSALLVATLWLLSRWGGVPVFHGPRYPLLGAGPWVLGCWLVVSASSTNNGRMIRAMVLSSPWLVSGLLEVYQVTVREHQSRKQMEEILRPELESGQASLYFEPAELAPYFRNTLSALGARPFSENYCEGRVHGVPKILLLNRWRTLDTPQSLLLHTALAYGLLGSVERESIPEATGDYELVSIPTIREREVSGLCVPYREAVRAVSSTPGASQCRLASQRFGDGWSYLEFTRRLEPFRWTQARSALLRFENDVEPGMFELHLAGRIATGNTLTLSSSEASWSNRVEGLKQDFEIVLPIEIRSNIRKPSIMIQCEELQPVRTGRSESFTRYLGVRVSGAELVPVAKTPTPGT